MIDPKAVGLAVLVTLLASVFSLTLYCAKAQEQESVTVYIINPLTGNNSFDVYDHPVGSVFTAEFYVGNVTNLVAWQIRLAYNRTLVQYDTARFPEDNVFEQAVERGATPTSEVSNNVNNATEVGDLMMAMTSVYPPDASPQYPVNVTSRGLLCEVNFTIMSHAANTELDLISSPSINIVIAPSYILPSYGTCVETINGTYSAGGDPALIRETNPDIPESVALMLALVGPVATLALILTRRKRARASREVSGDSSVKC
jgi:hypothetical protein